MKNFFKKYNIQLKLLLMLTIGLVILSTIYYFLIPMVLNYPQGTYGTYFQIELENTDYITQVVCIALAIFVIFTFLTFTKTHFLIKYHDLLEYPNNYSITEINYVKNKLFSTPYSLFLLNLIIPSIALTSIHAYTIHQFGITTLKLFILVISLMALYVTSVFVYTCNLFKQILLKLPYDDIKGLNKLSIKKRIFFNILPLILVSILFTSLLGYSMISKETGNSLFETYHNSLIYFNAYNSFSSLDELTFQLSNLQLLGKNDFIFIKTPNGNYLDINQNEIEMSNFFDKYLSELSSSNNGKVYEYYGIDCQAATINITINGNNYVVGIYYYILSLNILYFFTMSFFILVIINIVILFLFSRSISKDITTISSNLSDMVNSDDIEIMHPLHLTSNDEIGQLIIAYNNIQKLTKENIEQIHSNQDMLVEKERLASLGQLVGGIAHNLKTPIMSISGAAEGLTDLVKEYDSSIGDPEVNEQDHHDIAHDMSEWIEKIKTHTSYMSDIITAVKGQAVTLNENEEDTFTINELVKRVNILMKHELKNALIDMNVNMNVDDMISLSGNVNSLVQVINNIISNAIQAYNGETNKVIDLNVDKNGNNIVISVEDYGCGMTDEVKDKLFKEMITTKGKNGTGLGMFMSYSTIRGHFNGDITFDSTPRKRYKI